MTSDINEPTIPSPAEATDGSELGEQPGDETLPGTVDFPPTKPAGVGPEDSPRDAEHHDSVAERHDREQSEVQQSPHDKIRLVQQDPEVSESDVYGIDVPSVGEVSPEEAALHYETDG